MDDAAPGAEPDSPAEAATAPDPARPRIRAWRHLTGSDFADIDRERTVVIFSVSPLEVHGPHLPVTTDITEAEGLLLAAVHKVADRHPELDFLHLPPLWLAADVLPARGSIASRPSTVARAVEDIGRSLAAQGFRHVWISNFHGGPRHFLALEVAADRVNRRHGGRMVSLFGLLLSRLTEGGSHELDSVLGELDGVDPAAFRGDTHGGYVETSMMLHLLGEHVKDATDLPRNTIESWRERTGRARPSGPLGPFLETYRFFAENTYAGAPAGGSAALGARFVDTLAEHTADAASALWEGRLTPEDARSPLFRWRHALMNPVLGWAFERMAGVDNAVF